MGPAALLLGLLAWPGVRSAAAQRPWPLWEAYTQNFIDDHGRVIDHSASDRTTSEGQAYAMFFALVDDDRGRFDMLLHWTESNLAGGDLTLRLPAWSWGKNSSGAWAVLDDNSASDADLWLAYDLLEAGRLWHEARYANLGRRIAERIAQQEVVTVPGRGTWLSAGPRGFHPSADTYILNPSYMPLPLLEGLAVLSPSGPWKTILASVPALLAPNVGCGYALDWVEANPSGVRAVAAPAQPSSGDRTAAAVGSYDAIRVYLWFGLSDPGTPGWSALRRSLTGMADVLRTSASPPREVDATGKVLHADSPPGFSAAVIPYLTGLGAASQAQAQQRRLEAARDAQTGLYGRPPAYYDQNLVLFSTGRTEGRFRFARNGELGVSW